jgi:hypothetical protein
MIPEKKQQDCPNRQLTSTTVIYVLDDLELGFGQYLCPHARLILKTMRAHKSIWSIYAERTLIIF